MANYSKSDAVTEKYHISVPMREYYSRPAVYKVWFRDKFFINKGKNLFQSVQMMATAIERELRLRNEEPSGLYKKIVGCIKEGNVMAASVEVISCDPPTEFDLLRIEQEELNKHRDNENCLNDSFEAYIPKWISEIEKQKFLQLVGISESPAIKKGVKNSSANQLFNIVFLNKEHRSKAGVYRIFFGDHYYIGSSTLLYGRMLTHRKELKKRISGHKNMNAEDMYFKILAFISAKKLKVATCILTHECSNQYELHEIEQAELNKSKKDPLCLNVGFDATKRPSKKIKTAKTLGIYKNGKLVYIKTPKSNDPKKNNRSKNRASDTRKKHKR